MKSWEIIADNLSKAGWSWGCVSALDLEGRTLWIADAHRGGESDSLCTPNEKLTAFLQLERVTGESFRFPNSAKFATVLFMTALFVICRVCKRWKLP